MDYLEMLENSLEQNRGLLEELQIKEKTETEIQEKNSIIGEGVLTVDDLKKEYEFVFDEDNGVIKARKVEKREVPYTLHLPDGTRIQKTREENSKVSDYLFFKDKNGIVTLIPELSYMEEGDIEGNYYKSSWSSNYHSDRKETCAYDVQEWGFERHDEEEKRYDKYYRYVTLNDSQKLIRVFESDNHYIDKPWTALYHRNKDENGKQCIRLVDLQGNIHSIKEGGRVSEKGLKEKTIGSRDEDQIKVIYKDKEPVYVIYMPLHGEFTDFCVAEELRQFFGIENDDSIVYDENSMDAYIKEIIEKFNETFMQGEFVPSLNKAKAKKEEKSVAELAEELSVLTRQEQETKGILQQYEQQLSDQEREI